MIERVAEFVQTQIARRAHPFRLLLAANVLHFAGRRTDTATTTAATATTATAATTTASASATGRDGRRIRAWTEPQRTGVIVGAVLLRSNGANRRCGRKRFDTVAHRRRCRGGRLHSVLLSSRTRRPMSDRGRRRRRGIPCSCKSFDLLFFNQ